MATLKVTPKAQQEFLRGAMANLNMDETRFARRLGATTELLSRWLLPSADPNFKLLPELVWRHVSELLYLEAPRASKAGESPHLECSGETCSVC